MLQYFTLESSLVMFLFIDNNVQLFREMFMRLVAHVETYSQMVRKQITCVSNLDQGLRHCSCDISSQERMSLLTLRSRADIIKPADKGSTTVIMSLEDYLTKVMYHLNNDQFYEKLQKKCHVSNRHLSK